ncbi:LysM peptidoglycan-binding domain-containing M23 family metallopeptidase [Candidatus Poribacteria bacterium]|nr:LysM peptidoglycan-binding domain-containing M23 family metallopeptidase [Candidatus Poribacteria bacterium]
MRINKELKFNNNLICNLHYLFFVVFFCLILVNTTLAKKPQASQKVKTSAQKFKIHIVDRKDTLFSISKKYKISIGEIKRLNNMANEKIFLGQRLKISLDDDYVKSPVKEYVLSWPVRGTIVLGYGIINRIPHKGIDIGCKPKTPIKTALPGEIKYVGFFQSLENFVIVKHDDQVSTVYGNLGETQVKVGDQVSEGDIIGTTVKKESSANSFLHFEIRFNTVPKNPLFFLKK